MKAAIVTTLIDAEEVIDSFIDYHLKTGFSHLYLFFDNPEDKTIGRLQGKENITIVPCDKELRKKWTTTNAYAEYGHLSPFIESEPMARQILNMEIACQLAKHDGINWILHIDIDELFYSPKQKVVDHFSELEARNAFFHRYLNYEAVPEKETITDYFREVTLFKKNPAAYSPAEESNHKKYVNRELFNYYKIGKMAARVDKIYLSGIHEFVFSKENIGKPIHFPPHSIQDPVILHYVCCGFRFFWSKYATLGNFNPKAFGRHLYGTYEKAQNIITRQNDRALAKEFYKKNVMMSEEEIQRLTELNLVTRINEPYRVLTT